MKIISKYKDFYDYFVQDNDANMTYVREAFAIHNPIDSKIIGNIRSYSRYYYAKQDDITVNYITFGIYPYVYISPYVQIQVETITLNRIGEYFIYFFTKEDLEKIVTEKDMVSFCEKKAKEYCIKHECARPLKKYEYPTYRKNIGKDILNEVRKYENKKVFEYIKAPVFCVYDPRVVDLDAYAHLQETVGPKYQKVYYIANGSFTKLNMDMLKFWIDDVYDINTYNNIENFLWSIKQEPIANPDNKTKIINHGFDLKTSFRNVK